MIITTIYINCDKNLISIYYFIKQIKKTSTNSTGYHLKEQLNYLTSQILSEKITEKLCIPGII